MLNKKMWMGRQVVYEGHEFLNQSLRKDLKVYKSSATLQNIVNPEVFCSLENQALKCVSIS